MHLLEFNKLLQFLYLTLFRTDQSYQRFVLLLFLSYLLEQLLLHSLLLTFNLSQLVQLELHDFYLRISSNFPTVISPFLKLIQLFLIFLKRLQPKTHYVQLISQLLVLSYLLSQFHFYSLHITTVLTNYLGLSLLLNLKEFLSFLESLIKLLILSINTVKSIFITHK